MITVNQRAEAADTAEGTFAPIADDRIGAFAAYTIASDLLELREIYAGHIQRIPGDAWAQRTERRPSGWTLLETLAHLDAVASVFNTSVRLALAGQPISIPGLAQRTDLPAANRAAINERLPQGPAELTKSFLGILADTASLAARLNPQQLALRVKTPYYGAEPSLAEIFGAALIHAGVIHGAQVAAATRGQPIWSFYSPGIMRRQLTRAFHAMGLAYWPERGGSLHATLAFNVEGHGGGSWYIRVDPSGGEGHIGTVRTADVILSFASADLLCRTLTLQAGILRSVITRRLRLSGNLRLAARMFQLFTPT
ncbi:MAG: maleylpyruvate isomerase N-terminal domain-containing protein [Chloroflexales bacterium]